MYIQDQTIKKLKNNRILEKETPNSPHAHLGGKKKKFWRDGQTRWGSRLVLLIG